MSSQDPPRETRQTVKQRQAAWRSIKESMGDNEDPPAWADELLTQVTSIRVSFQQTLDELSNSMKEIKKDTGHGGKIGECRKTHRLLGR